jgi:anhydro-N-acetylmuramic acid kinase
LIVAGIMSGTSADGINVALVRLMGRGFRTRLELLAHDEFAYPTKVRTAILSVMNATASVADLARLNFLLGEFYAEAVLETCRRTSTKVNLIGCHGQTIYHQGDAAKFLGRNIVCTWQIGEGAIIAACCGAPVVSDFRPADMAVGGKGAPLVPFLDYILFRHRRRGRIVQNIGGIGNLTAIPPKATPEQVIAFDTGPGNMVIDQIMDRLYGKPFDKDGHIAARGKVLDTIVSEMLRHKFFRRKPPKTAGREDFGREFVTAFLRRCGKARNEDIVATATSLTARSICEAVRSLGCPILGEAKDGSFRGASRPFHDYIVSGGGAKNHTLMRMIEGELHPYGLRIRQSDDMGLASEAKEAAAFALLAYQTWRREPSNVPSATGATRPAILGKISYA